MKESLCELGAALILVVAMVLVVVVARSDYVASSVERVHTQKDPWRPQ